MSYGAYFFLAVLEGTVLAFVLAVTALGLSLVFGVMRVVNVAHGEFFMLGAVIAWWVSTFVAGMPLLGFLLALIVAPLFVGALAIAADWLILRRIDYDPESTIVATIGLLYIIQELTLLLYGPEARAVEAPYYFRVQFPWFGYSGYKLVVAGISALLLLATWLVLTRTRLGLYMRATQYDRETAQAFGISVRRIYATVFALGAGLAAIAGVLVVPIQQAHYLMGHDPLLLSFIVVIIGGLGSLGGTLVAAFVIGISDGVISVFFSPTLAKISRHPAGRAGAGVQADRPVRRQRAMIGASAAARWGVPVGVIAALALAQFALPAYHHTNVARIMVLATFAIGYNIAFGYAGLLSLGHAMFFAAGLYGAGMTAHFLHFPVPAAFAVGALGRPGACLPRRPDRAQDPGRLVPDRHADVRPGGLSDDALFQQYHEGRRGFRLGGDEPETSIGATELALNAPDVRYNCALLLFALCYFLSIVLLHSPIGRVLVAVRENEPRTRLLGTTRSATSCWR